MARQTRPVAVLNRCDHCRGASSPTLIRRGGGGVWIAAISLHCVLKKAPKNFRGGTALLHRPRRVCVEVCERRSQHTPPPLLGLAASGHESRLAVYGGGRHLDLAAAAPPGVKRAKQQLSFKRMVRSSHRLSVPVQSERAADTKLGHTLLLAAVPLYLPRRMVIQRVAVGRPGA